MHKKPSLTSAGDNTAHEGHDINMTSSVKKNGELNQILFCLVFYCFKSLPEAIINSRRPLRGSITTYIKVGNDLLTRFIQTK
jgi:hypothetical protein